MACPHSHRRHFLKIIKVCIFLLALSPYPHEVICWRSLQNIQTTNYNKYYDFQLTWRHLWTTPSTKITMSVQCDVIFGLPLQQKLGLPVSASRSQNWDGISRCDISIRISKSIGGLTGFFFRLVVGLTGRKLIGWDNNRSPLTFNDEAVLRNKTLSEKENHDKRIKSTVYTCRQISNHFSNKC